MKHYIFALCFAFSAVNTAQASQRAQDLPLNADSMIMRLGNAVDTHIRKNFTAKVEQNGIKFEALVDTSARTLAHAKLFMIDTPAPQHAVCFINSFRMAPEVICTEKQHLGALFTQKSQQLEETGNNIQTRISAPKLQPIIEQSKAHYNEIINRIDEVKQINADSHQQILKLL
jgi:hypothetical protein|tara:strand:- start:117 stop:635 length:519 start_codon:yes stop_codon:yes gene_type:complete